MARVGVGVLVKVLVGVGVRVLVGVSLGVLVAVFVGVLVGVLVEVLVGVGLPACATPTAPVVAVDVALGSPMGTPSPLVGVADGAEGSAVLVAVDEGVGEIRSVGVWVIVAVLVLVGASVGVSVFCWVTGVPSWPVSPVKTSPSRSTRRLET
jgi:hypothetical protein